jgi:hypothetical protein
MRASFIGAKVMRLIPLIALLIALLVVAIVPATSKVTGPTLTGGTTSKDDLVSLLVDALGHNDRDALRALRVNQQEYVDIILRGSVPKGQPLRDWPPDVTGYFFRDLDTKCRYAEQHMLELFGGHEMSVESFEFAKGTTEFANHVAYRQLRVKVKDTTGTEVEIATGSIAEVNGRYKFISFLAD